MSSTILNVSLQSHFQLLPPSLKRKLREVIVQSLYASHVLPSIEEEHLVALLMSQAILSKKNTSLSLTLTKQILQELPQLDALICDTLRNVPFSRIAWVEKQVLRLIVFEYLHGQPIDTAVLLSEATRLTKKFGYSKFCPLVHTILSDVFHSYEETHLNSKLALALC